MGGDPPARPSRALGAARSYTGIDFSRAGLLHFGAPRGPFVHLVHGSVAELPFRDGSFDVVLSTQVLEHLPLQSMRDAFLRHLGRVLKPGGRLVLTCYNWHARRRAKGVPKEGVHPNGIYFHCYGPAELRSALEDAFEIDAIWGVGVALPMSWRLTRRLGSRVVYWERFWRTRQVALAHGEVLLVTARRRAEVTTLRAAA